MSSRSDARRQAQDDATREWQAFPELPGTHLSWHRTGLFAVDLLGPNGHVWASVDCPSWYSNHAAVINAHGRTYEVRRIGKPKALVKELVDVANDATVMTMTGIHYGDRATTRLSTPDDLSLTFPVTGSMATRATMSAVNDAGDRLIRYRVNSPKGGVWAIGPVSDLIPVEVVVSDGAESIPNLALLIAVTSGYVRSFSRRPGA